MSWPVVVFAGRVLIRCLRRGGCAVANGANDLAPRVGWGPAHEARRGAGGATEGRAGRERRPHGRPGRRDRGAPPRSQLRALQPPSAGERGAMTTPIASDRLTRLTAAPGARDSRSSLSALRRRRHAAFEASTHPRKNVTVRLAEWRLYRDLPSQPVVEVLRLTPQRERCQASGSAEA